MIRMRYDRRGELGVGTMIVFIAMVLVAATSAVLLISTANAEKEKAADAGISATDAVSTGFDVKYVTGDVSNNQVSDLHVYLKLTAGSREIVLDNVIVRLTVSSGPDSSTYDVRCNSSNTATVGGMTELTISGLTLNLRDQVSMRIMPAFGSSTYIAFTIPDVLTGNVVTLR